MTDDDDQADPASDPDFISTEGSGGALAAGQEFAWSGAIGAPPPVLTPSTSTRLEEDGESGLPHAVLWSMKFHRHLHLFDRTDQRLRASHGTGDHAIFVIDDGRKHCVVGRLVGASPGGCTYCLVARITIDTYERLVNDELGTDDVFAEAAEYAVCAVYEAETEDAPSNVTVVEQFDALEDVPPDYLGPHPLIAFADVMEDGD